MTHPYDVITFDCYGTLIDWESGIRGAFTEAAARDNFALDPAQALAAYGEIEPVVEAEAYRSYRAVLTETAGRVARRLGWSLPPDRTAFLAQSLPGWRPFPDTNAALERLAGAGYRLGILSNVDDDLLAATRRHFTVPIDFVVTAQQVGSYKPAHNHFLTARRVIGAERWLHAAQSYFHDVAPAGALGVPAAWINRKGEQPLDGRRPDRELTNLTGLADWLAPVG